ncbi:MAG: DUF799 domain-containing protein [Planctomycetota bacterium]|jgi:hypothetical protein
MRCRPGLILIVVVGLAGCGAPKKPTDYSAFNRHMPRSILVLPPVNRTASAKAPDLYLSTVTRPLAEQGYYVYPIAVVDRLMKENGAHTPGDMHRVSLGKLEEVFGADAVLYIGIEKWTTSYVGIATTTTVRINYQLFDIGTGEMLWQRTTTAGESSAAYTTGEDPFTMMFAVFMAQVQAIGAAVSDPEVRWARKANHLAFGNKDHGLLPGPRHPRHGTDPRRVAQQSGTSP